MTEWEDKHCLKITRIWSFSIRCFPAFGLNTERHSAFLRIQFEWGENTDQKNSKYGQFLRSESKHKKSNIM